MRPTSARTPPLTPGCSALPRRSASAGARRWMRASARSWCSIRPAGRGTKVARCRAMTRRACGSACARSTMGATRSPGVCCPASMATRRGGHSCSRSATQRCPRSPSRTRAADARPPRSSSSAAGPASPGSRSCWVAASSCWRCGRPCRRPPVPLASGRSRSSFRPCCSSPTRCSPSRAPVSGRRSPARCCPGRDCSSACGSPPASSCSQRFARFSGVRSRRWALPSRSPAPSPLWPRRSVRTRPRPGSRWAWPSTSCTSSR